MRAKLSLQLIPGVAVGGLGGCSEAIATESAAAVFRAADAVDWAVPEPDVAACAAAPDVALASFMF
ncbi:hypothetical protein NS14008_31845 [Nocardia seriolae]|nr:hypothetical protein NS14008_31845 [Nocardia seriolae]PSK28471.1 hypothetical protein C6575_26345 [Nocardia seriolae]RLP29088.1 hypothetical protein D6158_25785 [Nocardia seriolae]BAW09985.1 conserved hypothetical protein [Nocardia seriolae]